MKETYDEYVHMLKHANTLDEALAHLSPERQELIRTVFDCHSFKVDIQREKDGSINLLFESITGSKLPFLPSLVKLDETNYAEYDKLLVARIIVEVLMLALKFVGVTVKFSDKVIGEAIKYISDSFVAADRVIADVKKLIADAETRDVFLVAMDIVTILIDMFAVLAGPVIRVFKILVQSLSWFSIIIIVCQALCFIVITTLSGGAAIIAKVISWLLHSAFFINKLIQKNEYDAITFPKQC
ncbi:uncharacterized protein LOC132757909 [Ruditapes philippinarum]|uniref:uncharacterized protein LOC132757909 n=1 Tax=Ruditapes philippinarum TaxID=129788 RepID=UPI00295A94E2|nr:uncharacterized protein LOC132757909 [Ruditapes philippinarum]